MKGVFVTEDMGLQGITYPFDINGTYTVKDVPMACMSDLTAAINRQSGDRDVRMLHVPVVKSSY